MTTIYLYGVVGDDGFTADGFVKDLNAAGGGDVHVRLDSPGGLAQQGISIHNAMHRYSGQVAISIDGWAASAASIVAMGASRGQLSISSNALMMVHRANLGGGFNAPEMERTAPTLRKVDENIASTYAERTGKSVAYWLARMDDETYYDAEEAVAEGLADRITSASRVAARLDMEFVARNWHQPHKAAAFVQQVAAKHSAAGRSWTPEAIQRRALEVTLNQYAERARVVAQDQVRRRAGR